MESHSKQLSCYGLILLIFLGAALSKTIINIYVVSPRNTDYPFSIGHLQPAADMAKEYIERENILDNHELNFTYLDSRCDPTTAYTEFLRQMQEYCPVRDNTSKQNPKQTSNKHFSAIFGPVCSYVISGLSRMNCNLWKVPIVTVGAFAQPFRNRHKPEKYVNAEYRFITAAGYHYQDPAELVVQMCKKYNWKTLVYFTTQRIYDYFYDFMHCSLFATALDAVVSQFREKGGHLQFIKKSLNISSLNSSIKLALTSEYKSHSIFVLCARPDTVSNILSIAQEHQFDNGEYVFINIDLFNKPENLTRPWEEFHEATNKQARSIYRNMFIVTLKPLSGEKFLNFSNNIKEIARRRYNFTYDGEQVNNFVAAFYDSVILYARAVDLVLKEEVYDISNGSAISSAIKLISFEGVSGNVTIDENGDRNAEYCLLDMDPHTGNFSVVGTYNGLTKQFIDELSIDWHNKLNLPPPDSPFCGYNNDNCKWLANKTYYILVGVFVVIFVAFTVIGFFTFRNAKFQAELKAMSWIISADTLESLESRFRRISKKENLSCGSIGNENKKLKKKKPKISKSQNSSGEFLFENFRINKFIYDKVPYPMEHDILDTYSCHSNLSLDSIAGVQFSNINNCKLYGRIAVHKGTIVALKQIQSEKKIETTRELLLEVKKLKDLNYHHICRFIGACLDASEKYIIYEYCCKGSLKDILAQNKLVLDWMFKYSLIQDICRGMIYIHNNIGPHGNLKSTKCLVDSRFVLKIAGFGCKILSGCDKNQYAPIEYDEKYYSSLLWTAPEKLRSNPRFTTDTMKNDVYSFAIICQEIIYRKGQFYIEENESMTAQEKISRVQAVYQVPFRPTIYAIERCTKGFVKIVTDAWSEYPINRPDFVTIKGAMRKLNRSGDTSNILDNLLSRMEQYANNLEDLVAERTDQYLDEKKKAEKLLYSMLPKSVAQQLILKQEVIAENYESVTVYFSDIVGFTSLSAESTPMQIVTLLNKLYTTFDKISEEFNVYKVETIGDAYVVCSGLPEPNENHARDIGRMSIAFQKKLSTFIIPHRPDQQLKVRIGIHSGPVCAGVVGLKMPRYCLFGDTVNTSSRMESSGLPLKIHISNSTKNILSTYNSFIITERGYVEMKGKGLQLTYWLHGEGKNIVDPINPGDVIISNFHVHS